MNGRLVYLIPLGFLGLAIALGQTGIGQGPTTRPDGSTMAGTRRAAPCGQPIKYKLGIVDPRFGMGDDYAIAALAEAAALWNTAAGFTAIAYDARDGLPVNFIYDDRQKTAQSHAVYATLIEQDEAKEKQIDDDDARVQSKLNEGRTALKASEDAFNADQESYNADVDRLNSNGGGSDEQVRSFDLHKLQLDQQQSQLRNAQAQWNDLVDQHNALVAKHNVVVNQANATIELVNKDVGKDFVAGLYSVGDDAVKIDIFAFVNRADLVSVLAHEFGHALGLGHLDDPKSVMVVSRDTGQISLESGTLQQLSSSDVSALLSICPSK